MLLNQDNSMTEKENQIWKSTIERVLKNNEDWPDTNRSERYHVEYKGIKMPPKIVLGRAAQIVEEEHPEIEMKRIGGGLSTNQFIEDFGFKITEDLVYNNPDKSKLIKHIETKIKNRTLFQDFINFGQSILSDLEIEVYKVRMAIEADGDLSIIVGMRAAYSYSEKDSKSYIGLLISPKFKKHLENKYTINYSYDYKGVPDQSYIKLQVDNWSEIDHEVLEEFKNQFRLQYEHIKDSKRTQWNKDAGTTSNALKYILFKNLNVNEFMSGEKSIQDYKNVPAYYCVGFHYYGTKDTNQLSKFLEEGIWVNGYKTKFIDATNKVLVGAAIAAKTTYTMKKEGRTIPVLEVHARGIVKGNRNDGRELEVDWEPNFKPVKLIGQGGYRNTISRVWNKSAIEKIFLNNINQELFENIEEFNIPLNQILYGPPGTGKTYSTKEIAVSIAKPDFDYDPSKNLSYREQINEVYNSLVESKQVAFTTFHQSFGYEDFVEGIKPETNEKEEVIYKVQPGVFKELCEHAEGGSETVEDAIEKFKTKIENEGEQQLQTSRGKKFRVGYNGGTTFRVNPENSVNEQPDYPASIDFIKKLYIGKDTAGMYNPSYVKSILEHLKDQCGLKDSKKAKQTKKNYVLIIDEINRGNVSAIFGELITLLEPDKRKDNKEMIEVTLPYSKETFSIPSNVYIIGTMNTADRSVEALDTALRRRFSFKEIMPDADLLKPQRFFWELLWKYKENDWLSKLYKTKEEQFLKFVGADDHLYEDRKAIWSKMINEGIDEKQISYFNNYTYSGIRLDSILKTINKRIEYLLDRDHTIGHSYFFEVYQAADMQLKLQEVFENKIIPLLQEYFYKDYSKIGLVLGDEFVEIENYDSQAIFSKSTRISVENETTRYLLKPFSEIDFDAAIQELSEYA
ncbi:dynein-related subfamily AAA family protein [Leeuwenhoekiella aequorea]|uniref:Dynein-related subfamily AAA family protein n=2 Tax=Leeuwenhoekiella aequorea TaxID=283736 RepID=A0A4Q0PCI2_9FLAO|nr:dynein-related subfamily AAA family protein [Leeuwenhoekiella aequorea]